MAGRQGKLTQSLQFKLSAWLSLVIFGFAIATGIFSFRFAFHEAIELQDSQLRQMTEFINRQQLTAVHDDVPSNVLDAEPESGVVVQMLRQPSHGKGSALIVPVSFPPSLGDGIQSVSLANLRWRVYVKTLDSGTRVAVAQQTAVRDEVARDSAQRVLVPLLALIPILLLLLAILIRHMFHPLKRMTFELDKRSDLDLSEIVDADLPLEIRPFSVAINRLLSRLEQSILAQRRFVSDAAHELRSPLTALSLHAEGLAHTEMSSSARERLDVLQKCIQRTRNLLEQLLAFARVQTSIDRQPEMVSVQRVLRHVLEDLLPLAETKNIDVGLLTSIDINVMMPELDLVMLVKNLIDNAIRYTPHGGKIDLSVSLEKDSAILQINDNGPGIPEHELARVFDPFYRVLGNDETGSGLGLSIVKVIADRAGAKIIFSYANENGKSGLSAKVIFLAA